MKKYGKYETKPVAAAAKQPKVKSTLLQTYITSLLCMVLCVTMFFGTSFAWFTSEVTDAGNEINVGILKVGLYKDTVALENDLSKDNIKLFDGNIRWEPGYTSLETIKVVNEGDLAFKYELSFTDGSLADNSKNLADVAKYFDVWVYDHFDNEQLGKTYGQPNSFAALTEKDSGWDSVGSLSDLLAGKVVLAGNMITVRQDDSDTDDNTPNGTPDGVKTVDTYTIALHMKENADVSVMGQKISLNVKLVAYQKSFEIDSFDKLYDDIQFASTQQELSDALGTAADNSIIVLTGDIAGDVEAPQREGVALTIDGNGHNFSGTLTVNGRSAAQDTTALTIQNINFTGLTGNDTVYINLGKNGDSNTRYTNHVTIKNCTFSGTGNQTVAIRSYTGGDKNLTIDGCTVDAGMHSLAQLKNVSEGLKVVDCKVSSKNGLNVNNSPALVMDGCTFDVKGYAVRFGSDTNTTDESFVIKNSTLKSACAETGDSVIEFRAGAVNATLKLENTTVEGTTKVAGSTTETRISGLN